MKHDGNIISLHRHIERRELAEASRMVEELRGQLRQRDTVLWAILRKHGAQTLTVEEMSAMQDGAMIRCRPTPERNAVTFSAELPEQPPKESDQDHGLDQDEKQSPEPAGGKEPT